MHMITIKPMSIQLNEITSRNTNNPFDDLIRHSQLTSRIKSERNTNNRLVYLIVSNVTYVPPMPEARFHDN